jgi:hypothetical protein
LSFWHDNIEAVISEVRIADNYETGYRPVKGIFDV